MTTATAAAAATPLKATSGRMTVGATLAPGQVVSQYKKLKKSKDVKNGGWLKGGPLSFVHCEPGPTGARLGGGRTRVGKLY